MSARTIDLELIRKFNIPGPRYTSYPPATHFTEEVSKEVLLEKIAGNNESAERDLSLYFHLPFCQSLCWFCGCTTVITTQKDKSAIYLDYLEKEVELMDRTLNPDCGRLLDLRHDTEGNLLNAALDPVFVEAL